MNGVLQNKDKGHIELILGPMFSGKTTELFRRIRRYTFADRKCFLIKYEGDRRYSKAASTHDKIQLKATSCRRLLTTLEQCNAYDVVGVDEGQFFPDLVEFCERLASMGKIIVVCALNGTYQRKPFEAISNIVPIAEKMSKLSAICMICFSEAYYTKRTVESDKLEFIGGAEAYIAVCRECYFKEHDGEKEIKPPTMFGG